MPKQEILKEYARLAIEIGVNIQKGQMLVINAPAESYELVRLCVEAAYNKGASYVVTDFSDNPVTRLNYENAETSVLATVPQWYQDRYQEYIDKGVAMLRIDSPDPDLMKGIDPAKSMDVNISVMKTMHRFQYYTMNNIGQWSILAYPNLAWALKVFPDKHKEEAVDALWDAIIFTSRVDACKTVDNWKTHNEEIRVHAEALNRYQFRELRFTNSLGTDLTVGLIKDHIWEGGSAFTPEGVEFDPNIPTEEVFTMPDRKRINGTVISSKPLSYQGNLISRFRLTFKDGVVTDFDADDNKIVLESLLNSDEGSRSLGEVALISYDSPISNSGILFYDTLFDENASCHLALGASYPTNVKGGTEMSREELYELGGNNSMNHVDFMFGTRDLHVTGTDGNGNTILLFENGNFII